MSKPNLERGKCKTRELSKESQEFNDLAFHSYVRIPMPYWQLMTDDEAKVLAYLWGRRDMYEMTDQLEKDGSFYCTADSMKQALQLSRNRQYRVLKSLEKRGYIRIERRGMPQKRFFKLNRRLITSDLADTYNADPDNVVRLETFRRNPGFQRAERKKQPQWGQFS